MMSFLSRIVIQKQLLSALSKGSIQSHAHRELFCYVRPCSYCLHLHIRCVGTSTVIKASRNPEDVVERRSFLGKKKKKQIVVKDFRDPVVIYPDMPANELADQLNISRASLFTTLNNITGINEFTEEGPDTINLKMATKAVKMYGRQMKMKETVKDKDESPKNNDIPPQKLPDPSVLGPRPSIVTIMGHVDHGKTTLLDALRKTNVVDTEFGGITQHIGAFQVKLPGGYAITFLDTPGHAAFTAMRARGASVTDIIVLVVAADDGLMQQTVEAINLARSENVPLIVAINKVDKVEPEKVEKVKFLLSQHGVQVEDMGGDVQAVPISALKGTNLDQLQECIVTLAEYMDLKADPQGHVEATVIESRSDPGKGKITTAIIQRGTLRKGDLILAGLSWAKVRALYNDQGAVINEAPPSTPVTISGWKTLPDVGDMIVQASSEKQLKAALAYRSAVAQEEKIAADSMVIEEKRKEHYKQYTAIREEKVTYRKHMPIPVFLKRTKGIMFKEQEEEDNTKPHLPVIIKGDVSGSVEAIVDSLAMFHSDMCTLDIMSYGVGDVTEQDVRLADSFKGVIYAFNVSVSKNARDLQLDVDIRHHKVIYSLFEDLVSNLNHILPPVKEEEIVGEAKIQQVFYVTEKKQKIAVAGCRCIMGTLKKRLKYRVMRNDQVFYEGQLASLKHHKEEVEEIKTNVECGLRLDTSDVMFEVNDIVVCYDYVEKPQTLDWQPDFT